MAKQPASPRSTKPAIPAGSVPFIAAPQAAHAAAQGETLSSDMDYAAHEAMFMRFTSIVKWGIVCMVVLVIFLFIVINPMVPPPTS
jgi:hypothetical protein